MSIHIKSFKADLSNNIHHHLEKLTMDFSNRHVGSPGNHQATEYFQRKIEEFGFTTDCPQFDCIDWEYGDIQLFANDKQFKAFVGPYSLPFNGTTPLVDVNSFEALVNLDVTNKILLIHGELAKEQLMPKNFPFYNSESHQKIIQLLEQKQPAAILAATSKNPEMVGALYPFPLFNDGDFDIPNAYLKDTEGIQLSKYIGSEVTLQFESKRILSKGHNVIARKGCSDSQKLIFCAHIDAVKNSPGALDDAAGIVTLLALAELLKDYQGNIDIEIIAFNGEDYYATPGQIQYLKLNRSSLNQIIIAINLDDVGYKTANTHFSFYECSNSIKTKVKQLFQNYSAIEEGIPWVQGDHMIFAQNQVPAIAFASENMMEVMATLCHTEKDTMDQVDCDKLVELALGLRDIINLF
ncbi:M28 family metallopeptidase [bacterium]